MRRHASLRKNVLIALATAGVVGYLARSGATPPMATSRSATTAIAAIASDRGGGGIAAAAEASASTRASGSGAAIATGTATGALADAPPALPARMIGDALLRGQIDLRTMQRVDDHYEIALAGGRRAILTLDPDIQEAAETVLARAKAPFGAVVVTAIDGRILALAGRRTEEPARERAYDLATAIWAPAASIFKIVTAAALLDAGVSPGGKVCFHGGLRSVLESNLADSQRDNRCESLAFGLSHSQNAIMGKLAQQHLDPEALRASARRFGLGKALDWALPGETGRFAIPEDKGLPFAKVAAGFWSTELSPMGGALLANTVASGGNRVVPRLVVAVIDGDRRLEIETPAPTRALTPDTARALADMMEETCERGSAAKAFREDRSTLLRDHGAAGKTGTLDRDSPYLQYSWFVGFAPTKEPAVSIAVLLGNGENWRIKAHSAARFVLEAALDRRRSK